MKYLWYLGLLELPLHLNTCCFCSFYSPLMVFLLPHIAHHHPDHVTFLHPEILSSLFLSSNFALTFLTSSIPWSITLPLPIMVILSAKSPCCTFFFLASELYFSHLLSQGNYSLYSVYPSNDIVRCFAFSHPSSQPHHHLAKDVEERVRGMGRYVGQPSLRPLYGTQLWSCTWFFHEGPSVSIA